MERRPRALIVTRNFPPLQGGMERVIEHAYLELDREFTVGIVGPRGLEQAVVPGGFSATCRLHPLAQFLACLQWKTLRAAHRFRPDLILAGSGLAAPSAVMAARSLGVPALCYVHGLDVVADSFVYQSLFVPAIRRCDTVLANSNHTARLAAGRGVPSNAIHILHPGTDAAPMSGPGDVAEFRRSVGAGGGRLLLSAGRLHPRKGLPEFIEQCLPAIIAAFPDTVLAIVGDEPVNAARAARGEARRITEAARRARVDSRVILTGSISDERLHRAYHESDALVFPVRDLPGDSEGFGLVAIEAAAHGLPTVAFAVGGVPDAVSGNKSGLLVAPGDYVRFSESVIEVLRGDRDKWRATCHTHARMFSWDVFGEKLRQIARDTLAAHPARNVS